MGLSKLDWTKLTTYQDFQRLVNHLVALELGQPGYRPGFTPSDPDVGADGGWDGRYSGTFAKQKGEWCFQAKYTRNNGAPAYGYLQRKDQIPLELEKAKSNGVDFLVMATNANLTVPYIRRLERLNNGQVKRLFVWPREELERRIQNQPWLRYTFFGLPQYPAFVPESQYSRRFEPLSAKDVKYHEAGSCFKEFRAFLRSDEKILVVYGAGGTGKSRLLREVSRRCRRWRTRYEPWFVRHGVRELQGAFQEELPNVGRQYLLICDDAGRHSGNFIRLVSLVRATDLDVKLLAACRTGWKDHVEELLQKEKLYGVPSVHLGELSEEQAVSLFRTIVHGMPEEDSRKIVKWLNRNPFWIVVAGQALASGVPLANGFSEEQLRLCVIDGLRREASSCIEPLGVSAAAADKLLYDIALLSPLALRSLWIEVTAHPTLPLSHDQVADILAERAGISREQVRSAAEGLFAHGILRSVGRGVRFAADMTGDVLLGARIDKRDGKAFLQEAFHVFRPISVDNVLRNIVQAQCRSDNAARFCRELLASWVNTANNTPCEERAERLRLCSKICYLAAREAVDLVYAYLDTPYRGRAKSKALLGDARTLTDDDCGPVLSRLALQGQEPALVARAIRDLASASLGGMYDNYKVNNLVGDLVRPSEGPVQRVIPALREISKWLRSPSADKSAVACAKGAVEEVLAGVHKYESSDAKGMTFTGRVLNASPAVNRIRNEGIRLLALMVKHELPLARRAGYEACLGIGAEQWLAGTRRLPLDTRIATDRKRALKLVSRAIRSESDLGALSLAETTLVHWWLCEPDLAKEAECALLSMERSPEYGMFQIIRDPDKFVETFEALAKKVPATDKWGWWIDQHHDNWLREPAYYLPLAQKLCAKYRTPTAVVDLLRFLAVGLETGETQHGHSYHILEAMRQIDPKLWLQVRFSPSLWKCVPEPFRTDIELVLVRASADAVDKLADILLVKTKCKSHENVAHFVRLLRSVIDDKQVEKYTLSIARQASRDIIQRISSDLFSLCYSRPALFPKLFRQLLKKDRPQNLLNATWHFLHSPFVKDREGQQQLIAKLRLPLSRLLAEAEKTDHTWYEMVEQVHQGNHTRMLAVMDARLKKYKRKLKTTGYRTDYRVLSPFHHNPFTRCFKSEADIRDAIALAVKWSKSDAYFAEKLLGIVPQKVTHEDGTQVDVFAAFAAEELDRGTRPAFKRATTVLSAARIEKQNEQVFLKLLEITVRLDELGLALSTVESASGLHGTSSRGLGEPNPRYAAARDTVRRLADRTRPGVVKTRLNGMAEHIEKMIEEELLRDEEELEPK